jgi:hypothetical protein
MTIREEETSALTRAREAGLSGTWATFAIIVHDTLTKKDVADAFDKIAAARPERPKRGVDPIDDLTAAQCVMWRVRCNATNAQVAATLGMIVGRDEYGRPARSVTAHNDIKRGEVVLARAGKRPEDWQLSSPQAGAIIRHPIVALFCTGEPSYRGA